MIQEQKDLLMQYGLKLGIDKDIITDLWYPSIDQLQDILKKDVEPYVDEWDRNEVKLNQEKRTNIYPDS